MPTGGVSDQLVAAFDSGVGAIPNAAAQIGLNVLRPQVTSTADDATALQARVANFTSNQCNLGPPSLLLCNSPITAVLAVGAPAVACTVLTWLRLQAVRSPVTTRQAGPNPTDPYLGSGGMMRRWLGLGPSSPETNAAHAQQMLLSGVLVATAVYSLKFRLPRGFIQRAGADASGKGSVKPDNALEETIQKTIRGTRSFLSWAVKSSYAPSVLRQLSTASATYEDVERLSHFAVGNYAAHAIYTLGSARRPASSGARSRSQLYTVLHACVSMADIALGVWAIVCPRVPPPLKLIAVGLAANSLRHGLTLPGAVLRNTSDPIRWILCSLSAAKCVTVAATTTYTAGDVHRGLAVAQVTGLALAAPTACWSLWLPTGPITSAAPRTLTTLLALNLLHDVAALGALAQLPEESVVPSVLLPLVRGDASGGSTNSRIVVSLASIVCVADLAATLLLCFVLSRAEALHLTHERRVEIPERLFRAAAPRGTEDQRAEWAEEFDFASTTRTEADPSVPPSAAASPEGTALGSTLAAVQEYMLQNVNS